MFGLFRRRKKAPPADPLQAYDGFLEVLERQGMEVRRSAATLLAIRGDLTRTEARHRQRLSELRDRLVEARATGERRAAEILERDEAQLQRVLSNTLEALARATADAELLLEAARELSAQLTELKMERESAAARLTAGLAVSETLRQRSAEVARVLALDAARDEVERAHALAELYREER